MKVIFPCKGVIVLTKEDVKTLGDFYQTNLMTSKVFEIYNTSEYMMQVGNFNYLPKKSTIVLEESKLLTIPKLRSILDNSSTKSQSPSEKENVLDETDNGISDDTILSHPFFQTLRPLN